MPAGRTRDMTPHQSIVAAGWLAGWLAPVGIMLTVIMPWRLTKADFSFFSSLSFRSAMLIISLCNGAPAPLLSSAKERKRGWGGGRRKDSLWAFLWWLACVRFSLPRGRGRGRGRGDEQAMIGELNIPFPPKLRPPPPPPTTRDQPPYFAVCCMQQNEMQVR